MEKTCRRLSLTWGCTPLLLDLQGVNASSMTAIEQRSIDLAIRAGHIRPGDDVVLTAGLPLDVPNTTNLIKVAKA